jgi:iron(III) transport system substrate-binding protein
MSEPADKNWPRDQFGRHEVTQFSWWLILLLVGGLAVGFSLLLAKKRTGPEVIVYCAQDQTYAEPILHEFEQETGIRVRALYDSEAVKTVGLANRLLAERQRPQCDVFWGNEEMRTRQLAALDVWSAAEGFATFGARVRCLVLRTNEPDLPELPQSLLELTNAVWRGRVAIAFPQFGTTATHFHVLRQVWGEARWRRWCQGLVSNDTLVLDGNSTVVKMVGRGEAWIGLTDTDDVLAGQREGLPVARGRDLPETLLFIPNTVGIVRGAPHPQHARQLSAYLQQPETVNRLLNAGAIQYAEIPSAGRSVLQPDWPRLLADLESTSETLGQLFLR